MSDIKDKIGTRVRAVTALQTADVARRVEHVVYEIGETGPEPGVTLASGDVVIGALYQAVATLMATGHTIFVGAEGDVSVDPPVHEDVVGMLGNQYRHVLAILNCPELLH